MSEFSMNDVVTDILQSNFTSGGGGLSTNPAMINTTFQFPPEPTVYPIEQLFWYIDIVTIVCLYIQMVLTVILNLTVVCYIVLTKAFSPINLLILNLVISDLFYAGGIPFYVRQFMPGPVSQTETGCRISLLIDWMSMIVSLLLQASTRLKPNQFIKTFCSSR